MASSSSSSHQAPAERYDVFISFRGEDTRHNFANHLSHALSRKRIKTFFDDEFSTEVNISSSILRAIEGSTMSIIIFSETYTSSKLCLMELEKILECTRSSGQIVIPVFYGVAPSEVRNQTGRFGAALARLEERLREEETLDVDKIRYNLRKAGNIAGWLISDLRDETYIVEEIVGDILNKLNRVNQVTLDYPSLVGIVTHIKQVETKLRLHLPVFRAVGICGGAGIGKTTIARTVIHHLRADFDVFYFVENVSRRHVEEIVWEIIDGLSLNITGSDPIMNQLQSKKSLIALDDIGDELKARELVNMLRPLLSGGSRILVTSREMQVLMTVADEIHEVEGLSNDDAFQLFSWDAFKRNYPPIGWAGISESVLKYANGNPLVLLVLGCALSGKSTKEEWIHVLDRLWNIPSYSGVQNVLRIGYDTLNDDEKKTFLQIARNSIGMDLKAVVRHYGDEVVPNLRKLTDWSLITMSSDKVEMHDLLREMAYAIIDDGNRRRVYGWSPQIPPKVVLNYVFPLTNLALESVVLTLEIIGSAQKPLYSLIALIVTLSATMVFLGELVYRGRHRNITLKWNGMIWKIKKQLSDHRPFFTWPDAFSLLCAICQLVSTTVGYSRQHKENPFKVSLVPLIYIICTGASHIVNKSIDDDLSMKRNE